MGSSVLHKRIIGMGGVMVCFWRFRCSVHIKGTYWERQFSFVVIKYTGLRSTTNSNFEQTDSSPLLHCRSCLMVTFHTMAQNLFRRSCCFFSTWTTTFSLPFVRSKCLKRLKVLAIYLMLLSCFSCGYLIVSDRM